MNRFIMTVGVPASGKSTYFRIQFGKMNEEWVYLSSDNIREELFGSAEDQTHNQAVFLEMRKRAAAAIRENKNIYYDATNINRKKRKNFLKDIKNIARGHDYNFECFLFAVPAVTCKRRNAKRERKVPETVIERMVRQFQVPIYAEGWDIIIRIAPEAKDGKLEELLEKARSLRHDNPHHKLTVGDHMLKAYRIGEAENELACGTYGTGSLPYSFEVLEAARYHDIGKPECKDFHDWHGKPTKIAHFYSHDNVSAYIYLCYVTSFCYNSTTFVPDACFYIAFLIEAHMKPYNGDYENWCKKQHYKHFILDLNQLHNLDMRAH